MHAVSQGSRAYLLRDFEERDGQLHALVLLHVLGGKRLGGLQVGKVLLAQLGLKYRTMIGLSVIYCWVRRHKYAT